jgi:hypothetical protein
LKRRKPSKIVVDDQEFCWLVNREYSSSFVHLRIWSATQMMRLLEVQVRCDAVWINAKVIAATPEVAQNLEVRPITPGLVRQVIEDALAFGWGDTGGQTPLRFDWDRDGQPEYRLLPWRSLGD